MITRADMETIIAVLAPVLAGNLAERLAPIEAELASLKAGALVPSNEAEADALAVGPRDLVPPDFPAAGATGAEVGGAAPRDGSP
jgi:hypothetical protein